MPSSTCSWPEVDEITGRRCILLDRHGGGHRVDTPLIGSSAWLDPWWRDFMATRDLTAKDVGVEEYVKRRDIVRARVRDAVASEASGLIRLSDLFHDAHDYTGEDGELVEAPYDEDDLAAVLLPMLRGAEIADGDRT